MSNNKRDKEEKLQEKSLPKVHIACEKTNYRKFYKTIENTRFFI